MLATVRTLRLTVHLAQCAIHITTTMSMASTSSADHQYYRLTAINWGFMEVNGINLATDPPKAVKDLIRQDVHRHRILIFRDQAEITGKRQVEISKWFGELDSTFYRHPASPDPDVFRVSNDENAGCTGVGRTGWHVDGSFQPAPFAYSLYHIVSVPKAGNTVFAPLCELIDGLPAEQRERWERLWMVSDRRVGRIHPLLYPHPITGKRTMCVHLGMTESFVWDYGTVRERWTAQPETAKILKEIHHQFIKDNGAIQYSHKYKPGDFIISDNIAVAHQASPDTQLPARKVGLRVMDRTTVKGIYPPAKTYSHELPMKSILGEWDPDSQDARNEFRMEEKSLRYQTLEV